MPNKKGKKVLYNWRIAERICERISEGCTLSEICREEGMPSRWGIYKWLKAFKDFKRDYELAREMQVDVYLDRIKEIAVITFEQANIIDPRHSKVAIDGLRVAMQYTLPKRFGLKTYEDDTTDTRPIQVLWGSPQVTGHSLDESPTQVLIDGPSPQA